MYQTRLLTALCGTLLATAGVAGAINGDVSLTAMSAREFRGITLNDGWVLEPALRLVWSSLEAGVNGFYNLENYDTAVEDGEFVEIDWDVAYRFPLESLNAAIRYREYQFPDGGSAWREAVAECEFNLPLKPDASIAFGFDGALEDALYAEFGIKHPFAIAEGLGLTLGARVGYLDLDGGDSGFSHYKLSATFNYGVAEFGVAYIGQINDEVLPDAQVDTEMGFFNFGYDAEFIFTAALKYTF